MAKQSKRRAPSKERKIFRLDPRPDPDAQKRPGIELRGKQYDFAVLEAEDLTSEDVSTIRRVEELMQGERTTDFTEIANIFDALRSLTKLVLVDISDEELHKLSAREHTFVQNSYNEVMNPLPAPANDGEPENPETPQE